MKEIQRIHIAKVPYDVELGAKKELEIYLKALETYSHDEEILAEVEIRITEILEERGVKKNGVITDKDVTALRRQLGEPREFMDEGDAPLVEEADTSSAVRKLFRDTDRAVLGGVLAGVAAFLQVNPAVVRLLFIAVTLMSCGAALIVYLVLWIVVPPARTAADRLQMVGRSVTIGAIRELNESDATRRGSDSRVVVRRVIMVLLGIASVVAAGISAMITIFSVRNVIFGNFHLLLEAGTGSRYYIGVFALAVLSGVLLTVLFTLTAYAAFVQKMTRRVIISICLLLC